MPEPLINLQRRLSIVGAIRAGGEKPERGVGKKLEHWRITSPRQQLVEQAATLYGGEVTEWTSPAGREYQVYTEQDEIPVLLMPSYSLRQTYELWEGATKRLRVCDGVDEELSGGPCLCNAEGEDKCALYTRLVVALPELDTMLGWRLITKGMNAAHELPTMFDAARAMTSGPFVPARLHLEQRRGVVNGQVARYVVPTLDLGVGYAALAAAVPDSRALPVGATATRQTPTIEQALSAADSSGSTGGNRRAAAFGSEADVEVDDVAGPAVGVIEQTRIVADTRQHTLAVLDVLVGKLRDGGHVTTDGLYNAIGKLRGQAGLDLAVTLDGYDENHVLHWAPLRDNLSPLEATKLLEWLTEKERRVLAAEAEPEAHEQSSFPIPDEVQAELRDRGLDEHGFPRDY